MNKYENFNYTNKRFLILETEEIFYRTEYGKSWKNSPDTVEKTIISPKYYTNYIAAIPFFNNFMGCGCTSRASWRDTAPGYLPTRVTTVSPAGDEKHVVYFEFVDKYKLLLNAGYREKHIVENAKRFDIEYTDDSKMIHFYTDENGSTSSGLFDTRRNIWRG